MQQGINMKINIRRDGANKKSYRIDEKQVISIITLHLNGLNATVKKQRLSD